uniref:Uncharacterized protein n=1 Tax=Arion vulgaris TaxID=1028688 RepID=A0A0B7A4S4_9EUPU
MSHIIWGETSRSDQVLAPVGVYCHVEVQNIVKLLQLTFDVETALTFDVETAHDDDDINNNTLYDIFVTEDCGWD